MFFYFQQNLCKRFQTKTDQRDTEPPSSSGSECGTNSENSIDSLCVVKKSATVDATDSEKVVVVPRTPETEGSDIDFEFVTTENIEKMAENELANGGVETLNNNNEINDEKLNFSVGDDATEATDKFPQQMGKTKSNWNMMELGEKRKRLR